MGTILAIVIMIFIFMITSLIVWCLYEMADSIFDLESSFESMFNEFKSWRKNG